MALSEKNAFTAEEDVISVEFLLFCTVDTFEIQQYLCKNTSLFKNLMDSLLKNHLTVKNISTTSCHRWKTILLEVEMSPQKYFF